MKKFCGVLPFIVLFIVLSGCNDPNTKPRYQPYPMIPGVEGGEWDAAFRREVSRIDSENSRNGYAIPLRCSKSGNPVNEPLDLCDLCK